MLRINRNVVKGILGVFTSQVNKLRGNIAEKVNNGVTSEGKQTIEVTTKEESSLLYSLHGLTTRELMLKLSTLNNEEILNHSEVTELKKVFNPNNINLPDKFSYEQRDIVYARIAHIGTNLEADEGGIFFEHNGSHFYAKSLYDHKDNNISKRITAFILSLEIYGNKEQVLDGKRYIPQGEKLNYIYDYIDLIGVLGKTDKELKTQLEDKILGFIRKSSGWSKEYFEEAMTYIKKSERKIGKNFRKLKKAVFDKYWEENSLTERQLKLLARKHGLSVNSDLRGRKNSGGFTLDTGNIGGSSNSGGHRGNM